jgi:VCBS repeat-containing protein
MLSLTGSATAGVGNGHGTFVSGTYVYLADELGGLEIVDVSDPTNPFIVGSNSSYTGAPAASSVFVVGDYAYVADENVGLFIFDITAPASPTVVGSYPINGFSNSVTVSGSYAYINDFNNGAVRILDVSNPSAPALVNTFVAPSHVGPAGPFSLAVAGNYLYIADFSPAIDIVNISDPTHPSLVSTYSTFTNHVGAGIPVSPFALAVSGDYLYVADQDSGFYALNISNPTAPVLVGSYDPGGTGNHYVGVQVQGNFAYVVDTTGNLIELDVSNPTAPTLIDSLNVGGSPRGLNIVGNHAFVADDSNGLDIVDLGNQISSLPPPTFSILPLSASKPEGNGGTTPFTFVVVRSGDTNGTTTIDWSVAGDSQSGADTSDFVGGSLPAGTLTFNPGESIHTITVNVQADTAFESNETFTVNLQNATSGAVIDSLHPSATGQIINDEVAPPPLPDLKVDATLVGDITTLHPGGSVAVLYETGQTTGPFVVIRESFSGSFVPTATVGLYLSTDSTVTTDDLLLKGDLPLDSNGVDGAQLPFDVQPGQYYLGLIADPFNKIVESNENNNVSRAIAVTVIAVDQPPVAFNIAANANEDAANPVTLAASYTDADLSDTHTFTVNTSGTLGNVTAMADGTLNYDPAGKFEYLAVGETAVDTFTYRVDDGHSGSSTALAAVTIHGENDAPQIGPASFGLVSEQTSKTALNTLDSSTPGNPSAPGKITFTDPDLSDRPTASVVAQTVVFQDSQGHAFTLSNDQIFTFKAALEISGELTNTNVGTVDWLYSIPDSALDFLGVGESVIVTTKIQLDDHHGGTVTQDIAVTINGANDSPLAHPDNASAQKGTIISSDAAHGVLSNDTDPDTHDVLHVSAVNGVSTNVGHSIAGAYGALNLGANGSYSYSVNQNLGSAASHGGVDTFSYSVDDGHGGSSISTLNIAVGIHSTSNFVINPSFDPSVDSAFLNNPTGEAAFKGAVAAAISFYEQTFTDNVTLNITFGLKDLGSAHGESAPEDGADLSFAQVKEYLLKSASSSDDKTAISTLHNDPTNNGTFFISSAEAKAFGLPGSDDDGTVWLNSSLLTDYNFDSQHRAISDKVDATGVLEHEISETMGRIGLVGQDELGFTPLDLFRFTNSHERVVSNLAEDLNAPSFFSIDGKNNLAQYDNGLSSTNVDARGDFGDWINSTVGDAFGGLAHPGAQLVTSLDLKEMDIIGWHLV